MRIILPLLLFALVAQADIIPDARKVVWQGNTGVSNGIPNVTTVFTNMAAGSTFAQIQNAVNICPSNQVVQLTNGNFSGSADFFAAQGVVLRGTLTNGLNKGTKLTFSSGGTKFRFKSSFSEAALSVDADLSADATNGGTTLTLASVPSWVTVGELIGIDQLDDPAFVNGRGTQGSAAQSYREIVGNGTRGMGQLARVVAKSGTTITTELPLFYSWQTARTAQIFQPYYVPNTTVAIKRAGLEDMVVTFGFSGSDTHGIVLECADNCWVKNVEIDNIAGGSAVWPVFSYRCEFRDLYVHDSHLYGGGQGYGVTPWHVSTACLTIDCIIRKMHVGTGAIYGSAGNAFALNYIYQGQSDAGQNPGISTHGVHPTFNLWEGNFCEDKALADWTHGSSSHNTLFRNRISGTNGTGDSRCCVSLEVTNRYWNVVGNISGVPALQNKSLEHSGSTSQGSQGSIYKLGGIVNINDDFSSSDAYSYTAGMLVLLHEDYDTVTSTNSGILWSEGSSEHTLLDSYLFSSTPTNFGILNWPPFNPHNPGTGTNTLSFTNIPAGWRVQFGSFLTNPPAAQNFVLGRSGSGQPMGHKVR